MELKVGMPAPDFTLPLATFGTVALSNMRGKPVVLYFYPKDDTPGCTTEACDFRTALPAFGNFDAAVIGISKDTVESHSAFSKKYGLNFHLASDAHAHTCEDYGVWVKKSMYGQTHMGIERTTFLVDRHGIIRHIWRRVSVPGHVEEVQKLVEALHHGLPLPGDRLPEPVSVKAEADLVDEPVAKVEAVIKAAVKKVPEKAPEKVAEKVKKAVASKTVVKAPVKAAVKAPKKAQPVAVKKTAAKKVEAKKPVVKATKPAGKSKVSAKKPTVKTVKAGSKAKPIVKKPVAKAKAVTPVKKVPLKQVKKPAVAKTAQKVASKPVVAKKTATKKPVQKKKPTVVVKKVVAKKPVKKVVKAAVKVKTKAKKR